MICLIDTIDLLIEVREGLIAVTVRRITKLLERHNKMEEWAQTK